MMEYQARKIYTRKIGKAARYFLSSEIKSRMTIMQETVDQINAIMISGSFIQIGITRTSDTIRPIIARGSIEYPITLVYWNTDLQSILSTLCFLANGSLHWPEGNRPKR